MASSSPPTDPADEVHIVRAEMLRIEQFNDNPYANQQYVDLRRRLNNLQSTTRSLLPEILAIIFQHASPFPDVLNSGYGKPSRIFHLVLQSVSSLWYDVVQSTPQLWNYVAMILTEEDVDKSPGLYIKLCLDNSGCLPLSINIHFPSLKLIRPGCLLSPTVDDGIIRNAYRIQNLQMLHPPSSWLSLIPTMHQLNTLGIVFLPEEKTNDFLHLPESLNLTRIFLYTSIRDLRLNSTRNHITRLALLDVPVDICMNLFIECRNLVELHCGCLTAPIQVRAPCVPAAPILFKFLSRLSWELLGSDLACWDELLLRNTRFPALAKLSWTNRMLLVPNPSTTSFFANLPQSLDTLSLYYANGQETTWHDIRYDADIRTLEIINCDQSFLHNVFQHLSKKMIDFNEWIIPFPNLTRISYRFDRPDMPPWSLGSEIGEDLVLFLEDRIGIIDRFTIWFSEYNLSWGKDIWHRLEKFQAGGLDLNIGEHGKVVDILSKCKNNM